MQEEGVEQEILLQPEFAVVGAVYSVNGYTGHVVLKTSDLQNDSGYQTSSDVSSAISTHNASEEAHPYIQGLVDTKQDKLTAGTNIQISEQNVISATDTVYSAGNGINISGQNAISVDTTIVATQQNLSNEVTNRENADIYLQQQIDGISASSDVVDIVGTYAELQAYDTQHLKDNDIVKVLQDETQGGATTYYRWSTSTQTFTLIGQEGPYYTKASADSTFVPQTRTVNSKALSSNITLTASDVSALGTSDVVQSTGSSTSQVMSQNAVTTELNKKLNTADYVVDDHLANSTNPVQNQVLNGLLGDMPSDFFSGTATSNYSGTSLTMANALCLDDMQILGNTTQQTYSGKNLLALKDGTYTNSGITVVVSGGVVSVTENGNTGTNTGITLDVTEKVTLPVGTYTLSKNDETPYPYFHVRRVGIGNIISTTYSNRTVTTTTTASETIDFITLYFGSSKATSTFSPQLEAGSTPTSWEPFVGGIPSPNPDYPQNVNVVTGVQNVWVHGKNLFNKDTTPTGGAGGAITVTPIDTGVKMVLGAAETYAFKGWVIGPADDYIGKTLTVSANITKSADRVRPRIYLGTSTSGFESRQVKADLVGTGKLSGTWTVDSDSAGRYICVAVYGTEGSQAQVGDYSQYDDLLLEISSSPTSYESYVEPQSYTINLGSTELCKIGDYQDKIYTDGTDWYVHKECGKVILDGTVGAYNTTSNWYYAGVASLGIPTPVTNGRIISDYFTESTAYYMGNSQHLQENGLCAINGNTHIVCRNTDYSGSTADYQTWLGTTQPKFYYQLATPTDTKITDATLIGQLEAVKAMSCYAGNTYVEVTASDLAGILDVRAVNANANGLIYKIRGN